MPPKAAAKAAAVEEAMVIYDAVELSAIVAVYREELIRMNKELRDGIKRIVELEDQVTRP